MVTQSRLKELLHYDMNTGALTWVADQRGHIRAGANAGSRRPNGYLSIKIRQRAYYAHRLAWLYVHGVWPKHQIDHINGVRDDNRLVNLREATIIENRQNITLRKCNTSGFVGVSWCAKTKKWYARIGVRHRTICLGYYESPESAHAAYCAAKAKYHTFNPVLRDYEQFLREG